MGPLLTFMTPLLFFSPLDVTATPALLMGLYTRSVLGIGGFTRQLVTRSLARLDVSDSKKFIIRLRLRELPEYFS